MQTCPAIGDEVRGARRRIGEQMVADHSDQSKDWRQDVRYRVCRRRDFVGAAQLRSRTGRRRFDSGGYNRILSALRLESGASRRPVRRLR